MSTPTLEQLAASISDIMDRMDGGAEAHRELADRVADIEADSQDIRNRWALGPAAGEWYIDPAKPEWVVSHGTAANGGAGLVAACEFAEDAARIVALVRAASMPTRPADHLTVGPEPGAETLTQQLEQALERGGYWRDQYISERNSRPTNPINPIVLWQWEGAPGDWVTEGSREECEAMAEHPNFATGGVPDCAYQREGGRMSTERRDVLDGLEGYTPGPWEWGVRCIETDHIGGPAYGMVMDAEEVSCGAYCQGGQPIIDISDADKALIARAPDLVAEIRKLRAALVELFPADLGFGEEFGDLIRMGLLVEVPADDAFREEFGSDEETMWTWIWNAPQPEGE